MVFVGFNQLATTAAFLLKKKQEAGPARVEERKWLTAYQIMVVSEFEKENVLLTRSKLQKSSGKP
jgi:hypothetical protein